MIYGYARVSTVAQDLANQLAQLKAAGCEKVFREKITGTTADRPQLKKLMSVLAPGDVVIIPAVDRLSRDTTDLMVIARDMQRAGAGLRSLAEPVLDTTGDFAELVLAMLGVAAKLERRRIVERTARGRADAKAKGVKFGRKPSSPHTSSRKHGRGLRPANHSAASLAATTSVRRRFRGSGRETKEQRHRMVDRVAIVKTGWSDWYQGGPVVGRFGYLNATEEGQKGHECYNFKPAQDGTYYGYLPPIGRGPPQPRMKDHWLLIFIAAFEGKGPLTFVGWYEDATFAEGYTERPEYRLSEPFETDAWGSPLFYCISAKRTHLVPLEKRTETLPGHHMRRSPIAYVRGQGEAEPWRESLAARAEELVTKFLPVVEVEELGNNRYQRFPARERRTSKAGRKSSN